MPHTVARWEWGTIRIPALLPLALEALENRIRKEQNMGLLMECPECKKRNSQKAKNCKCGFALAKFSGRVWWIEYYDHDKRLSRERIGPNKAAAEQRYREVMSDRTEGRYIKKSPDACDPV